MHDRLSNPDDSVDEEIYNHLVRVALRYDQVQPLFTGELVVADRLPRDAVLVQTFEEPERREYNFVFRHESFPEVPEGEVIPKIEPEYRRVGEEVLE